MEANRVKKLLSMPLNGRKIKGMPEPHKFPFVSHFDWSMHLKSVRPTKLSQIKQIIGNENAWDLPSKILSSVRISN